MELLAAKHGLNTNLLSAGATGMGAGLSALAAKVETALQEDRYSGHVFVFRGRRGDLITVLVLGDTFWYAGL